MCFSLRAPWTIARPHVISCSSVRKAETSVVELKQNVRELQSQYPNFSCTFTDGSKSAVGYAFIIDGETH